MLTTGRCIDWHWLITPDPSQRRYDTVRAPHPIASLWLAPAPWVSSTNIDSKGTGATTDLHACNHLDRHPEAGGRAEEAGDYRGQGEGEGGGRGGSTKPKGYVSLWSDDSGVYILCAPAVESGKKQRGFATGIDTTTGRLTTAPRGKCRLPSMQHGPVTMTCLCWAICLRQQLYPLRVARRV